jgi:hypothetical protein
MHIKNMTENMMGKTDGKMDGKTDIKERTPALGFSLLRFYT